MKKIAFMGTEKKGGPYYIYQSLVEGLQKKYADQFDVYFFNTKTDRLKLHFASYDIIISIIPFLFKPLGTKKYIYNLHGNFEIEKKNKGLGNKLLYLSRYNLWFCNKILLNSYFLADTLNFKKKYNAKIEILGNPINFITSKIKKSILNKDTIKILTVSSTKFLEKGRGIIDLGNQMKNIISIKVKRTIIAGGNKENQKNIQKTFDRIKIPSNIKITRLDRVNKEELQKHYKHNDVFVYGTRLDTWGMTIMEAMSYGLPVLLLEYSLWKYIYPKELITNNISLGLKNIIENYEDKSLYSINFTKQYYVSNVLKKLFFFIKKVS